MFDRHPPGHAQGTVIVGSVHLRKVVYISCPFGAYPASPEKTILDQGILLGSGLSHPFHYRGIPGQEESDHFGPGALKNEVQGDGATGIPVQGVSLVFPLGGLR